MHDLPCKTKRKNSLRIRQERAAGLLKLFFFSIICLSLSKNALSVTDTSYYKDGEIRFQNHIYSDNIHTVQIHRMGDPFSYPLIDLNGQDRLLFSFDDLDDDIKNYEYRFIHCNFNWVPSSLGEYEYLDGYYQNSIRDNESSFNTFVPYTHYTVELPNEDVQFTKSGNYLLVVYLNGERDNPVITRRFSIAESVTSIDVDAHAPTIVMDRDFKQEIDFSVNTGSQDLVDPLTRMHVVVMQNGRWDNASMDLTPKFIKDREIIFDDNKKNVFNGLSEYRQIAIQSVDYQTEQVDKIVMDSGVYHFYLLPDEKRTFKQYSSKDDFNGGYFIKLQNSDQSEVDADYVHVTFYLKWFQPITDGSVYIMGALADNKINERFKMSYNPDQKRYEKTVLLKQGYYDYMYGLVRDNSNEADISYFEGMHFETGNRYQILVYHSDYDGYDRLIGYRSINTLEDATR